jgi:Ser/Thr protein kinase RdoA (MazF antagonist)
MFGNFGKQPFGMHAIGYNARVSIAFGEARLHATLLADIEARYDLTVSAEPARLTGGEQSDVYRVESERGPLVVRVNPHWRRDDEIGWVHAFIRHVAADVPQAIAPLSAADGSTLFRWDGHPVSVFPFCPGQPLDIRDSAMRLRGARLLRRIHDAALCWEAPRKPSSADDAPRTTPGMDSPEMRDAELDGVFERMAADRAVTVGPIHGDYYPRNILCEGGHVLGVIDWDEARIAPLIEEIGWVMWEFCQYPSGDDLDFGRAAEFLAAYYDGAPGRLAAERAYLIAAVRWRLRWEVRHQVLMREIGAHWDLEYMEQEIRAFARLRGRTV